MGVCQNTRTKSGRRIFVIPTPLIGQFLVGFGGSGPVFPTPKHTTAATTPKLAPKLTPKQSPSSPQTTPEQPPHNPPARPPPARVWGLFGGRLGAARGLFWSQFGS